MNTLHDFGIERHKAEKPTQPDSIELTVFVHQDGTATPIRMTKQMAFRLALALLHQVERLEQTGD